MSASSPRVTRSRYAATRPEIPPPTMQYDAVCSSRARSHSECTNATTSVMTPGSVAGSTPWPRLNTWPVAPASTARRPSSTTARAARSATGDAGQQHDRIEVALQGGARRHPGGGIGQRRAPVHADHRAGGRRYGLGHRAEQLGGADAEVRHRHPGIGQRLEHPGAVRQHVGAVVGQRQRPGPGVEHLDGVHPRVHLRFQERDGEIGQRRHQRVPGVGLAEHHRLGALVVAARSALDEVGRQRERSTGEADQRDIAQLGSPAARPHRRSAQPVRRSRALIAATSAAVRIGCSITGPTSGTMSSSMPEARSGTTMSENRMAASTPCLRTGCRVISHDQLRVEAGGQHAVLWRAAPGTRAANGPACRMNHTGTRLGLRPPAAARYGDSGRSRRVFIGTNAAMRPGPGAVWRLTRDGYGAPAHRPGQMV